MSVFTKFVLFFLRSQLSGWHKGTIAEQRTRQERSTRFLRVSKQIRIQRTSDPGVLSEMIEMSGSEPGIILYLHGGAFALGSVNSHRELISRVVKETNCKALAVNYPLAPENPFPAALEDAIKAYEWLLKSGYLPSQICIAGDSAGGGLAISTLLALQEKGIPLPAGAFCFSPWFDLTLSGNSIIENMKVDPILCGEVLKKYVDYYIGDHQPTEPLISPLFADLNGLPPLLIHSGRDEILLDDSVRFYEKAKNAGVDITLTIWDDMFHVFQLFSFLPATKESIKQVSAFVSQFISQNNLLGYKQGGLQS